MTNDGFPVIGMIFDGGVAASWALLVRGDRVEVKLAGVFNGIGRFSPAQARELARALDAAAGRIEDAEKYAAERGDL